MGLFLCRVNISIYNGLFFKRNEPRPGYAILQYTYMCAYNGGKYLRAVRTYTSRVLFIVCGGFCFSKNFNFISDFLSPPGCHKNGCQTGREPGRRYRSTRFGPESTTMTVFSPVEIRKRYRKNNYFSRKVNETVKNIN